MVLFPVNKECRYKLKAFKTTPPQAVFKGMIRSIPYLASNSAAMSASVNRSNLDDSHLNNEGLSVFARLVNSSCTHLKVYYKTCGNSILTIVHLQKSCRVAIRQLKKLNPPPIKLF